MKRKACYECFVELASTEEDQSSLFDPYRGNIRVVNEIVMRASESKLEASIETMLQNQGRINETLQLALKRQYFDLHLPCAKKLNLERIYDDSQKLSDDDCWLMPELTWKYKTSLKDHLRRAKGMGRIEKETEEFLHRYQGKADVELIFRIYLPPHYRSTLPIIIPQLQEILK